MVVYNCYIDYSGDQTSFPPGRESCQLPLLLQRRIRLSSIVLGLQLRQQRLALAHRGGAPPVNAEAICGSNATSAGATQSVSAWRLPAAAGCGGCIASKSEVIRDIVSGYCPCCGVPLRADH